MKKKKAKERKIYRRLTFWLGVLVLGTLVGVSIQFGRAWVEPSLNAPDGNIAAPINTGATDQTKQGDICTMKTGEIKCLSDSVIIPPAPSISDCALAGGVPMTVDTTAICKFTGSSCPQNTIVNGTAVSWTQYLNYSETTANTCTGTGNCATSVTSGFHSFDNITPAAEALEAKTYYSGDKPWIVVSCPNNTCTGYSYWGCNGYYCSTADQVWGWGTCSTTPSTCVPTKVAVGCII
ncbi:MAG: hypothetical protein WC726_03110 [Parcubacteria group bacterium]|jgi:hypothetical protein